MIDKRKSVEVELKEFLDSLAKAEMNNAIKNHGYYSNAHEASSVLREEIEEVSEALELISNGFEQIWRHVRKDECVKKTAKEMEDDALNLVYESLQVLAVIKKIGLSIKLDV